MATRRFKVLQAFPVWRRKEAPIPDSPTARFQKWDGMAKLGEVFELEKANPKWSEVGGGYFRTDLPESGVPDFSGVRLTYLLKHKYLEEI